MNGNNSTTKEGKASELQYTESVAPAATSQPLPSVALLVFYIPNTSPLSLPHKLPYPSLRELFMVKEIVMRLPVSMRVVFSVLESVPSHLIP